MFQPPTPKNEVLAYWWRAKDTLSGAEFRARSVGLPPPHLINFEWFKAWVTAFFRNLELIEYEVWSPKEHGHRVLYPVPKHNVKFDVPIPSLEKPESKRTSVLVSTGYRVPARPPIVRRSILSK